MQGTDAFVTQFFAPLSQIPYSRNDVANAARLIGFPIQNVFVSLNETCRHGWLDDADILCGGTSVKLIGRGFRVKFVSVTDGRMGHHRLSPDETARTRRAPTEADLKLLIGEI